MIPTIGLMIGGYIIFRCIEIACRALSQFASHTAQSTVRAFAVLVILITGFFMLDLLLGGVSSPALGGAAGTAQSRPETCRDPHERLGSSGICFCVDGYKQDITTLEVRARMSGSRSALPRLGDPPGRLSHLSNMFLVSLCWVPGLS